MTIDELCSWHFAREGWSWREDQSGEPYWESSDGKVSYFDPFPTTIDGAASAMPLGWNWWKSGNHDGYWYAGTKYGPARVMTVVGADEVADRYLLAKLAWEAMA